MPNYRTIPHTADMGLYACGQSLDEAYTNTAYGMYASMTDLRKVRETEVHHISISKKDKQSRLLKWLNQLIQLIYFFDAHRGD